MRRITAAVGLLVAFAIDGNGAATACGAGKLIFEDKFAAQDKNWTYDGGAALANFGLEGLVAKIPPGRTISAIHGPTRVAFEVCATFKMEAPKGSGDFVAVRFWTTDGDAEYWAVTFPGKGAFVVNRYVPGQKVVSITSQFQNASLLKQGTNEVSVSVDGAKGTFAANGKKITDFTGDPPKDGSVFGFVLYSGKANSEPTVVNLQRIELREVGSGR